MNLFNTATIVLPAATLALLIVLVVLVLRRRSSVDTEPLRRVIQDELQRSRLESAELARGQRAEIAEFQQRIAKTMLDANQVVNDTLAQSVAKLQEGNEKKLDAMRQTVDEKLQGTLEKRLGESFKLVSERLEAVQRGLGEMRELATGVGDLKRMLGNVKTRGTFGEVQLQAIIEEILTPEQYVANYAPRADSQQRVEYAVRMPTLGGANGGGAMGEGSVGDGGVAGSGAGAAAFLPIDSKFPIEDYQRLLDASNLGDAAGVAEARRALLAQVRSYAKSVREKYVHPPTTTETAVIFLPTEGLFAEVLREPGMIEELYRLNVMLTGPTTLVAVLSGLRVGFRAMIIEQRSAEVWEVLGAVKSEFEKFGGVLERAKKQLGTVSRTLEQADTRTRAMARRLRDVQGEVQAGLRDGATNGELIGDLTESGAELLLSAPDWDDSGDDGENRVSDPA